MSHSRCPLCRAHHYPRCRATGRRWPTAALYAMVPNRRPVTALSAGPMPDTIDDATADRWAVKLGFHPEQVWPGWCEAALRPNDDLFVNGCETAGPGWRQAWDWWEAQRSKGSEVAA